MPSTSEVYRSAWCLGGRQQILAALAILGLMCAIAGAQINVNKTGLHDAENVYGLYAPSTPIPYVNSQDISLLAWGETDASLYATVWFNAHGLRADVNLVNTGAIAVTANGGLADTDNLGMSADARAVAFGIFTLEGMITNHAQIDVTASGGTAWSRFNAPMENAQASGLATGLYANHDAIDNTGKITLAAYGGRALADSDGDAVGNACGLFTREAGVNNSGDVTVTVIGGTADTGNAAYTNANATGLSADGNVNNTGDLAIAATAGSSTTNGHGNVADAYALGDAQGITTFQGTVNNSGRMIISATGGIAEPNRGSVPEGALAWAGAIVNGIFAPDGANNRGSMVLTATGGSATADGSTSAGATAYGIRAYGPLNNSSNVIITATGGTSNSGTAAGAYAGAGTEAWGLSGYDLNNIGTLTVVATSGTAIANNGADVSSYARGLAGGVWGGSINNTGAISVTATAGAATGTNVLGHAEAYGIIAGGNVYNSGAITATATAKEGFTSRAYGIQMAGSGNLTNTGIIRATANTAYELYVAAGTTRLADTYNVTLDGDPNRASLGVADGATLALNNATLTVTALSGQTLWDTQYRLFTTDGNSVVDGNFASVQAVNPNTTVTYCNQGTAGSVDDTVSLAYTPVASVTLASAAAENQAIFQAADVVNRHMTTTLLQNILDPPSSGLLANAGSTAESLALAEAAPDKTSGIFVEPYYSRLDRDADPLGFEANLWGFSAGFERYVDDTLLGLHLGYGQSDIEYTGRGYSGNSEEQDVVTAGFSGLTRWDPWTLRYGLTGFYGRHDYEGLTGLSLDEREIASYDSYGTAATLMAGRIFQRGRHVFLPEAGLDWLWAHRERYTTEATDPNWDTTYSAMNDHDLRAVAALRWLSSFLWHDIRICPSASLGVRHLLTDADTSAWQSVDGAIPVLVKSEQDRTAIMLSGSLVMSKTRHAISLAYDGDYSPDAQRHSIWLRYSWLF